MNKLSIILSSTLLLSVSINCFATPHMSDSLRYEIRKVSNIMYNSGNLNYIDADALCDGLIQPDKWYDIDYKDGKLTIYDAPIPEKYKAQYDAKLKLFLAAHHYGPFSTKSDGVKLSSVFDATSTFRKRDLKVQTIATGNLKHTQFNPIDNPWGTELTNMLAADHLLDTSKDYTFTFADDALVANGVTIDAKTVARYKNQLQHLGLVTDDGYMPVVMVTRNRKGKH
jgi:hypothetical protein